MMVDDFFIIRVSDYQPELLGKPRKRISNKTESLDELPIICVDVGVWSIV